jgi:hypothetical protein
LYVFFCASPAGRVAGQKVNNTVSDEDGMRRQGVQGACASAWQRMPGSRGLNVRNGAIG